MDKKDAQNVADGFKDFRANPCVSERLKFIGKIIKAAKTDKAQAEACALIAQIASPESTVAHVHKATVASASRLGVDVTTLGGGPTPD